MTHHDLREEIKEIIETTTFVHDQDYYIKGLDTSGEYTVEGATNKIMELFTTYTSDLQHKIKGMKKDHKYSISEPESAYKTRLFENEEGYNQALQDVLQLITERKQ